MLDGKSWMGVAKTTNSGADWQLVWKESDAAGKEREGQLDHRTFRAGLGRESSNSYSSSTRSQIWPTQPILEEPCGPPTEALPGSAQYSRKVDDAGWTSRGLDVTTSYGIHFDPFDLKAPVHYLHRYRTFSQRRRRQSRGHSSTAGVPREWMNTTYWVVFDPKVRGRMWSVNSYTHDLPRPKMWRHNSVLTSKAAFAAVMTAARLDQIEYRDGRDRGNSYPA